MRDEASTGSKSVGVAGGKVACSRSNKTVGVATTEATCSQSTKTVCARGVATAKTSHGTSLLCHSRTCILLASTPSMPGEIKIVNPLGARGTKRPVSFMTIALARLLE